MIAAVLCGGKGKRLRSMIGEHQKCAVEVGGRPWIHRVLDQLALAGLEKAILLSGFMAEEVDAAALAWHRTTRVELQAAASAAFEARHIMELAILRTRPSGAEAAVQLALKGANRPWLLVVNGDTLVEGFDLLGFIKLCEASRRSSTVRGPNLLNPAETADSGIYFRAPGTRPTVFPTVWPFLDIGTPEGLAEARRRFE